MEEIRIPCMTFSGHHFSERYSTEVTKISLDLRDIAVIDLSALAWCLNLEELNLRGNELQGIDLSKILADVARHYLHQAISESDGNRSEAARLLGLGSYQTFNNWLKRYGLDA